MHSWSSPNEAARLEGFFTHGADRARIVFLRNLCPCTRAGLSRAALAALHLCTFTEAPGETVAQMEGCWVLTETLVFWRAGTPNCQPRLSAFGPNNASKNDRLRKKKSYLVNIICWQNRSRNFRMIRTSGCKPPRFSRIQFAGSRPSRPGTQPALQVAGSGQPGGHSRFQVRVQSPYHPPPCLGSPAKLQHPDFNTKANKWVASLFHRAKIGQLFAGRSHRRALC